jgi:hypothetical protein
MLLRQILLDIRKPEYQNRADASQEHDTNSERIPSSPNEVRPIPTVDSAVLAKERRPRRDARVTWQLPRFVRLIVVP